MSALPPFADVQDVVAIWRDVTSDEAGRVAARIDQASQQVRDEIPLVGGLTVDERIADGSLSDETVRRIVVAMVHRVVSIPSFARQRTVTVDDGSTSTTYDASVSGGEMFITDREFGALTGRRGRSGQRAFTITPGAGSFPWT